jgi:hypothetical protein
MANERQDPQVPDQPIKSEPGFILRIKRNFMARRPVPKTIGQPPKSQNGGSK